MTLGLFPIYVINNILDKPGTLSLDDMLFGEGGSWDTQHLKIDSSDRSFTKDPRVCVCKLGNLTAAAAACLPLVHFYFARLELFIHLIRSVTPVSKQNVC